ncbi:MAG: hypothetical protein KF850_24320 [Labilithrix sp.]|nr:hypothetical protein [Labilithrix sp.]
MSSEQNQVRVSLWNVCVVNEEKAKRINGRSVKEGTYRASTDRTEAFFVLDGAVEVLPANPGGQPLHAYPWAASWLESELAPKAERLYPKGEDDRRPDAHVYARARVGAAITANGLAEAGSTPPIPGRDGATDLTREISLGARVDNALAFGCSREGAEEVVRAGLPPECLDGFELKAFVAKRCAEGSRLECGSRAKEADAAVDRAREEKEAEERRRRELEEEGNKIVPDLARATKADFFVLDEVTGELTVVHDGGIGLNHDGRDGKISPTQRGLRTDSPDLPPVKQKDLPLLRHVTAIESVTDFITGRNLVEERNRLRTFEQIPAGKGTDLTDPGTHYVNEQIRAHADVHGLWPLAHFGNRGARALIAALYPAGGVAYDVALDDLIDLAAEKFREVSGETVAQAQKDFHEQQARARAAGEVKGAAPHEYKAYLEESLAKIERNARETTRRWTPEQIEADLKRAFAGPGAIWTPGSLRRPPSAEWLNRHRAEVPELDPLKDDVLSMFEGRDHVVGADFETELAAKGEVVTPTWRHRVAALMRALGFAKKKVPHEGKRVAAWVRATENETPADDAANESEAAE